MAFPDTKHPLLNPDQLYQRALGLGVTIDHHESDLFLPVTPETIALVKEYRFAKSVKRFVSTIDGRAEIWYEIPFAYSPFWEPRA